MSKIRFIVMLTLTVVFLSLLAAAPVAAKKPLHHASGDGYFNALDKNFKENDFMFQFNARQMKTDGTANGHMESHNLTKGFDNNLEIVYMEFLDDDDNVDDNTVGMIGVIIKTTNPNVKIGECRAMIMQDNGEGRKAPDDQTSKLSKPKDSDETKCPPPYSFEGFSLEILDGGNIQVR